jgi:hypothetical protein
MYITFDDAITRYQFLADWGKGETDVNSALIYYAEIELNEAFAPFFSVPFSAAHPTIKDLAIDMTYYKSLITKDPEKALAVSSVVYGRINRINKGEAYIYTGSGTTIAQTSPSQDIWSTVQDYEPTHSMLDAESTYTHISSERLNDEENARS